MKFTADESNVKVLGRSLMIGDIRYLSYSGSYVEFEFHGKYAKATLWSNDNNEEDTLKASVAVYINDSPIPYKRFLVENGQAEYELYSSEKADIVKLRLVKMSEAAHGKLGIATIEIDGDIPPTPTKYLQRKIEFIGDSITCGYGNEGIYEVDHFCTKQENPMEAFAVLTAERLKADYHLVSWSGIGIISNWIEETIDIPSDGWLMPMLYQYTDASLSDELKLDREVWDSNKFIPDVIVINLGTNDMSYTREQKDRNETFGKKYYSFLEYVRMHNKNAQIICTFGVLGYNLSPEIEKQVKQFSADYSDSKIHFMSYDLQIPEDGIGADCHPSKITHQKMANRLVGYIENLMNWK